jgi:thiamine-phosphate pyrophosphorylase
MEMDAVQAAAALLEAGVRMLQYRHKDTFTDERLLEARSISAMCQEAECRFVVNDRADIAYLAGAGVHLGQTDLLPEDARRIVGSTALIGFSTHNENQLRQADGIPADYLAVGPIFATQSKTNPDPVIGLDGLRALRALTAKPLVAIGGIRLETARDVLAAGADTIAVISDILPGHPGDEQAYAERAREWLKALSAP